MTLQKTLTYFQSWRNQRWPNLFISLSSDGTPKRTLRTSSRNLRPLDIFESKPLDQASSPGPILIKSCFQIEDFVCFLVFLLVSNKDQSLFREASHLATWQTEFQHRQRNTCLSHCADLPRKTCQFGVWRGTLPQEVHWVEAVCSSRQEAQNTSVVETH